MTGSRLLAFFPIIVCTLCGCSNLMRSAGPLPDGYSLKEVAKVDAGAPFAVNRSGQLAAVSKGVLQIIDSDGVTREILEGAASALSFSPGGDKLAVALPGETRTMLRLFDRQGKLLAETDIPERATSMAWRSESQLLTTALGIRRLASGSELTSRLYLWNGSSPPAATTLSQVTVLPPLAKLPDELLWRTLSLAVSPYGDEIAYSSPRDRQTLAPYQSIAIRQLSGGAEREVGKTSVGSGGPLYAPDGDSLLVGDDHALTRRLSIPDGRELYAWPSPGYYPAISASGAYTFLDGHLYQDGRSILSLPTESRGAFLPDGSGLAISYDGKLYLISGLKDRGAPGPPADLERLLRLRRLRSLGLISEREYRAQKAGPQPR